jgi:PPOX class probable F420-dependent enzyme
MQAQVPALNPLSPVTDSNRAPFPYEGNALPNELTGHGASPVLAGRPVESTGSRGRPRTEERREDRTIHTVRLPEGEARARFATATVARLGTADARGRPHVVVVTFAVDGDTIYTAVDQKPKSGANLKRLRNVAENPRVTVLADHYSDDWDALWWARADGRAEILADQPQMAAPLTLLTDRYWQYRQAPPTGPVIAVTVERWSGWAASR